MENRMDSISQPLENDQLTAPQSDFSRTPTLLQEYTAAVLEQQLFKRMTKLTLSLGILIGILTSMILLLFCELAYAIFNSVEFVTSWASLTVMPLVSFNLMLAGIVLLVYSKTHHLRKQLSGSQGDTKIVDDKPQQVGAICICLSCTLLIWLMIHNWPLIHDSENAYWLLLLGTYGIFYLWQRVNRRTKQK